MEIYLDAIDKEIIRTLYANGIQMTVSEISKKTGISWVTVKKHLKKESMEMVISGRITSTCKKKMIYDIKKECISQAIPLTEKEYTKKTMDKITQLKKELTMLEKTLHEKNLKLDALHYVWCNGGCKEGVNRYSGEELTEEIVLEAERNTKRLREYYEERKHRDTD